MRNISSGLLALMTILLLPTLGCGGEEGTVSGGAADEAEETVAEAPPPPGPQEVAEQYLRAGSAEDEARVRELLDPACHADQGMVRVDAARVMGAPITIAELTITPVQESGDTASVRYEISGSAHSEGGTTEIMGMQVQTGAVDVENASQSGPLNLRRLDGEWRVACGG